jgi:GT2 family glycosyltransferase
MDTAHGPDGTAPGAATAAPLLTVIVVSYNTRALTLKCLETLHAATRATPFETIVWDNASTDGSAEAIAAAFPPERFPALRLVACPDNLGFACANNRASALARGDWLLLLNPDTEVHDGAIDRLVAFAESRPGHCVYGGRTVFPDGSLNIASCWNRITPWSAFCRTTGLTALFKRTDLFDPEAIGPWARDSVREVDIVVGCFFLMRTADWRALGGFDERFWMYGEEADLCLRAARGRGRPIITPEATIMHLVGAASATRADKVIAVAKARATLMRRHWPRWQHPFASAMEWLWIGLRYGAARMLAALPGRRGAERLALWRAVWTARTDWMAGYDREAPR